MIGRFVGVFNFSVHKCLKGQGLFHQQNIGRDQKFMDRSLVGLQFVSSFRHFWYVTVFSLGNDLLSLGSKPFPDAFMAKNGSYIRHPATTG